VPVGTGRGRMGQLAVRMIKLFQQMRLVIGKVMDQDLTANALIYNKLPTNGKQETLSVKILR